MKNKSFWMLPIGTLFLAIALMMGRFLPGSNFSDFMQGFLVALSLVFNLKFAYRHYKQRLILQ